MKFILGTKIEMSQVFDEKGNVVPVTLIEAGPCFVTQIKTKQKDGYTAVQIGLLKKKKNIKKTEKGKEFRYLKEWRMPTVYTQQNTKHKIPAFAKASASAKASADKSAGRQDTKAGDKIDVSVFKEGDKVKISGISKGKGFAGVIKRHGFHGQNASHGVKHEKRTAGSTGSRFPQRVIKGKKMAGRMGAERVTVKNLKIVKIDPENNLLAVKGAIPGRRGTLLEIRGE